MTADVWQLNDKSAVYKDSVGALGEQPNIRIFQSCPIHGYCEVYKGVLKIYFIRPEQFSVDSWLMSAISV